MRWPLLVIGFLVGLVFAVAICEALGWPFLVGPLERTATKVLDRQVSFGSNSSDPVARIGLLGSVRVSAPTIEIASPKWSDAPYMLRARDARLKLGYLDLWRGWRGAPLNVAELEAADLDAHLERNADGQASWQLGQPADKRQPDAEAKPPALPTFDSLRVDTGRATYRDAVTPAKIDASFALRDSSRPGPASPGAATPAPASRTSESGGVSVKAGGAAGDTDPAKLPQATLAPGETGLKLNAVGNYQKLAVQVDLRTSGALSLLADGKTAPAQPVALRASVGSANLTFDGSTTDPLHLAALSGKFSLAGPSLAAVAGPLGLTVPETPEFDTHGSVSKDGAVWSAHVDEARIGSSQLNGDFKYDPRPDVPLLSGELMGKRLLLADLGPAIGAPPRGAGEPVTTKGSGKVLPDKQFDLPSLRAMDADVKVDIARFDTGTDVLASLRPMRAHLLLKGGVLNVAGIEASTAKGRLTGDIKLDGREKSAKWKADLGLRGVDLAQWLRIDRDKDAPPYLSGKLDAKVDVAGAGRSTAEILGSLGGTVRAHMRNATISHLAIEAAGLDIAQALGVAIEGDTPLAIQCNVIDLEVKRGLVKPRLLVLNTEDSTLWIDGIISLKTESMGLKVIVAPKDFSPLSLRSPIEISGTLSHPSVSIEASKLAAKAGAAALLALVQPLAAVIPFIDTGSEDEAKQAGAQCAALAARGSKMAIPQASPNARAKPAPRR